MGQRSSAVKAYFLSSVYYESDFRGIRIRCDLIMEATTKNEWHTKTKVESRSESGTWPLIGFFMEPGLMRWFRTFITQFVGTRNEPKGGRYKSE